MHASGSSLALPLLQSACARLASGSPCVPTMPSARLTGLCTLPSPPLSAAVGTTSEASLLLCWCPVLLLLDAGSVEALTVLVEAVAPRMRISA